MAFLENNSITFCFLESFFPVAFMIESNLKHSFLDSPHVPAPVAHDRVAVILVHQLEVGDEPQVGAAGVDSAAAASYHDAVQRRGGVRAGVEGERFADPVDQVKARGQLCAPHVVPGSTKSHYCSRIAA